MVRELFKTYTYEVLIPSGEKFAADISTSVRGEMLALDVRTLNGSRVLPGMGAMVAVVKELRDSQNMTGANAKRYLDPEAH